jgi:hypothetical protein
MEDPPPLEPEQGVCSVWSRMNPNFSVEITVTSLSDKIRQEDIL